MPPKAVITGTLRIPAPVAQDTDSPQPDFESLRSDYFDIADLSREREAVRARLRKYAEGIAVYGEQPPQEILDALAALASPTGEPR
jgi:hypothetical protein